MACQCHQVGGPFIAEDPDCPAHGVGGYQERLEEAEAQIERLREQIRDLGAEPVS